MLGILLILWGILKNIRKLRCKDLEPEQKDLRGIDEIYLIKNKYNLHIFALLFCSQIIAFTSCQHVWIVQETNTDAEVLRPATWK